MQVEDAPPIFQFKGHPSEGFAMAWSPSEAAKGHMLTGSVYLPISLSHPQLSSDRDYNFDCDCCRFDRSSTGDLRSLSSF